MKTVRLNIVTTKIVQISDDGDACGERCQFLHGASCWLDGVDDLDVDVSSRPIRTSQCVEAEI